MPLLARHPWIFLIAATSLHGLIWHVRSRRHVAAEPALAVGYRRLIAGLILWGNLPWVVMALGLLVGGVPSIREFSHPRQGGPFVLAFYLTSAAVMAAGTYWLLGRGGAEAVIRHPGLISRGWGPRSLKAFWCLGAAVFIAAAVREFLADAPPAGPVPARAPRATEPLPAPGPS